MLDLNKIRTPCMFSKRKHEIIQNSVHAAQYAQPPFLLELYGAKLF